MYVANNETVVSERGILNFMPKGIRRYMWGISLDGASGIQMRLGKPLTISYGDGCFFVTCKGNLSKSPQNTVRITREHITEALEIATGSSVYSVSDEIKNGFITVSGGHRIGISGRTVIKEDKVSFIKDISSLSYRLACEVIGAADKAMPYILHNGKINNTLIISPPGAGKTTMLRDVVRQLSHSGYRVSVVDERREIAAMLEGRSIFDLGYFTDVLDGCSKADGMLMMLRSMSPDVIVTDEIGTLSDIEAIEKITNSGAVVIATVHGENIAAVKRRADLKRIAEFFDTAITLSRRKGFGTIEEATDKW